MTDQDKKNIRTTMIAEIARLKGDINKLKEVTQPTSFEDMDEITRMDILVNRSVNDAALTAAKTRLAGLEHALTRLESRDFGYCTECGDPIPVKRLLSMPEAILCVDCAE
jgi:DnaK suppressor protein